MNRVKKYGPIAACTGLLGVYAIGTACADTPTSALQHGLAHCAAIAGRDDRLACYDALATQDPTSARTSAPTSTGSVAPPATKAPGPAASAKASVPSDPDRPEDFGLSPAQKAPPKTTSITARVVGFARNKEGAVVVNLDNGQSWELDEGDPLLASGDSVTIRRAALGSFVLTTPTHRTHRAHRTS
jgi:hypothetical protein